ncbi:MAG: hypothetical protein CM15mP3_06540 [Candidatus Poseidoniales archaeon]|nr:MAG: hypothetical protein CM15mP3_06540 [Candidatus Poseidoniales archaeon]
MTPYGKQAVGEAWVAANKLQMRLGSVQATT